MIERGDEARTRRARAVGIEDHLGAANAVGDEAQVTIGDGIASRISYGGEKPAQVEHVGADGEVRHVAGTGRNVIELEDIGAGTASKRVGTAPRNENIVPVATRKLRAGVIGGENVVERIAVSDL